MNPCRRLIPSCQRLGSQVIAGVPVRTLFSRGALTRWNMLHDMERQFTRMEREMNEAFRDSGLPVSRVRSFFEPPSPISRTFPTIETETTEDGKPGKYCIRIDVGEGFAPEDLKINLKDRMVTIHAKMEKKSDEGRIYQEVSRSFTLPEGIRPEEVKSFFSPDGILMIEAPLPFLQAPQPKEINISVESKTN